MTFAYTETYNIRDLFGILDILIILFSFQITVLYLLSYAENQEVIKQFTQRVYVLQMNSLGLQNELNNLCFSCN